MNNKSTETLHDIVEKYGDTHKQQLNKDLHAFRLQIKKEILRKVNNSISMVGLMYVNNK